MKMRHSVQNAALSCKTVEIMNQQEMGGKTMKKKKWLGLALIMAMLCFSAAGCSSTVDEPCMYCGHSPSKEYEKSDGSYAYVCEDCSSTCMLCGDKATKYYESLLGVVFVCDDCYSGVTGQ